MFILCLPGLAPSLAYKARKAFKVLTIDDMKVCSGIRQTEFAKQVNMLLSVHAISLMMVHDLTLWCFISFAVRGIHYHAIEEV